MKVTRVWFNGCAGSGRGACPSAGFVMQEPRNGGNRPGSWSDWLEPNMPKVHQARCVGERRNRNDSIRALQGAAELMVYAVRTNDGLIKIGGSANVVDRLDHIQGGVAEILALKPGTRRDELDIHHTLEGHAAQGREYYYPTPAVLRAVNAMRVPIGLDPIVSERRWAS